MIEHTKAFCRTCQRKTSCTRNPTTHTAHADASLYTCGLWLPVWFFLWLISSPRWKCQECGGRNVTGE